MNHKLKNYVKRVAEICLSGKDISKRLTFPKRVSDDLAYLCGILAGDGNIYIREYKYDYTLTCVGNPADEIMFYQAVVAPLFQNVFNLKLNIGYKHKRTTFGFVIHSKALCTYLTDVIQLPKGKKHPSLRVPHIFLHSRELKIAFLRGLFDTDGCISFKRKYKIPYYYPVISLNSKTKELIKQTVHILKELGFRVSESYDYRVKDKRTKKGYTIINRIDICGKINLKLWMKIINFSSPKHLEKIKNSAEWI
jgi:intein/homing endonuclease